MIRHQFRQVETQIEGWLQLSAAVLADFAGHLAMVTTPRHRVDAVASLRTSLIAAATGPADYRHPGQRSHAVDGACR